MLFVASGIKRSRTEQVLDHHHEFWSNNELTGPLSVWGLFLRARFVWFCARLTTETTSRRDRCTHCRQRNSHRPSRSLLRRSFGVRRRGSAHEECSHGDGTRSPTARKQGTAMPILIELLASKLVRTESNGAWDHQVANATNLQHLWDA